MTEKRKVVVKINGQEFTVIGNESEEYIMSIADFVDDKLKKIQSNNKRLNLTMAAILTAFNIADQYYKNYIELNELKEEIEAPLKELEKLREDSKEYKEKEKTFQQDKDSYKDQISKLKRDLEKQEKTVKKQNQALRIKEDEIQKSEKIISELQNKLFENQLELVQAKKELNGFIKNLDKEKTGNKNTP